MRNTGSYITGAFAALEVPAGRPGGLPFSSRGGAVHQTRSSEASWQQLKLQLLLNR
ncbi:unnamed protein product, partial [Nesidiocoris tenuis]